MQEPSVAAALVAGKERENFGTGYPEEYKKCQSWQQSWKGKVQGGKLLFIRSKIHEEYGGKLLSLGYSVGL